jgi:hypothetical protein
VYFPPHSHPPLTVGIPISDYPIQITSLTYVPASDDVTTLGNGAKVVEAVVDEEAADAALEAGIQAQEVADVPRGAHPAQVHRLVEGDPREEALEFGRETRTIHSIFHLMF